MRLGLVAEGIQDRFVLASGRFPQPLFDVMGTMLLSRAVMAGVRFGVFDRLAAGAKTAAELAAETGCYQHGMTLLLDALVACRYLERDGTGYRNAALGERWLRSDREPTLANFVRYNYDQWDWVSHLEDFIQRGEARDIHEKLDAAAWRNYMLGLRDIATLSADEMLVKIKFTTPPRRLLDIGAGHCYYTIAFCRRYPELRATVVDLEPASRVGQEFVARAGLGDRVEFRIGNLTETPFGESCDAAFLFNVVHHLDAETNRAALRHVHAALATGGRLLVWEPFREERKKQNRDQMGSLLALFFGLTSRRQSYTFSEVAGWAQEAGFRRIQRRTLRSAPGAPLLIAAK